MDPDAARALAVAVLTRALADLEHSARRAGALRWIDGGKAPVPFATAAELAGLDVDAVRERVRDKLSGSGGQGSG